MTAIMSLTVTVRMRDGELRAGLELRAMTAQDGRDLAALIDTAKQHGLYDESPKILDFNGLGANHLHWCGLGVDDRVAFEAIPCGNWANVAWRVLYLSDPRPYVEEPDDLSETCLCQNDYSCQICRLQKKVKFVESELLEAQNINAKLLERTEGLLDVIEQRKNNSKKSQAQDGKRDEAKGDGVEGDGNDTEGEAARANVENEREDEEEGPTAFEHALYRAQTAELENGNLLVEIARLKRENEGLRKKLSKQRNASSSPMTQMTNSMHTNPSVGGASYDSYSDLGHIQYGHGGKTRPGVVASSGAQPVGRIGEVTGGKMSGRDGDAKTTKDPEKMANKRQRATYDEDEDGDENSDEEPPFKRHRSAAPAPAPGRAIKGRKGGRKPDANTCRPEIQAKKKHQDRSDDSDDESYNPTLQDRRSGLSRSTGRTSAAPKANQIIAKKGRCTNNSQASFLDAFRLGSLTSSSPNTPNIFGSGSASNTMSAVTDNESDASIPDTPKATISNAATPATTLAASAPPNPVQPATTSRKAQGWSNTELQALIALVRAHHNAPVGPNGKRPEILHDVRLFELMSRELQVQGITRSAGACKNEWNRRGRQASGIDNRKIANPNQMATSLQ